MADAPGAVTLAHLADVIAALLEATSDADNFPALYVPSERPITRLGFALEPDPGLVAWVVNRGLDALFVHRPWRLDTDALPPGVGVIAFHQPFDATFAVGYNVRLADALGLRDMAPLGEKDGVPLGMIGDVDLRTWEQFAAHVRREFDGLERVAVPYRAGVARVAVMGAMNDELVRRAHQVGANAYVTGQMRVPARDAVRETGLGVIAVGHARGERWGLRMLAMLLRERCPDLHTVLR